MADLLERNEAMQKRNAQRLKKIMAEFLIECEMDATRAVERYKTANIDQEDVQVVGSIKYWENVASACKWIRERLRVKPVDFLGPLPTRTNKQS